MDIFSALWPVFALLVLGVVIHRTQFLDDHFWANAERFIYFICFPSLLVTRLAPADFNGAEALALIESVLLLLALGSVLLLISQRIFKFKAAAFTSVFQGGMRFNTYITLAIAASLDPGAGLALAAIIASVMIPLLNVLCVLIFALYSEVKPSFLKVLKQLATNPLILACLLGITLNLTKIGVPGFVAPVLNLLAQVALPLGLLAVGAAINLKAIRRSGMALGWSLLFRLGVMPLLALAVVSIVNLSYQAAQIFMIFAAVPTASAGYILARQLGGDAPLFANILSAQVMVSIFSLPIALSAVLLIY